MALADCPSSADTLDLFSQLAITDKSVNLRP